MANCIETQIVLPGLEGYVCTFECLTRCPLALDDVCFWDDPLIGEFDLVEYPEFFWWRVDHNIKPEEDWSIHDPDPTTPRCPRCHSVNVRIGYPYMKCLSCDYSEPLIDFPISHYYHLALGKVFTI